MPIEDALEVAEQIEDGTESGDVQIGPSAYLGIAVTQSAASTGVQVGQVQSGGAAADAGIEAGATITPDRRHRDHVVRRPPGPRWPTTSPATRST